MLFIDKYMVCTISKQTFILSIRSMQLQIFINFWL